MLPRGHIWLHLETLGVVTARGGGCDGIQHTNHPATPRTPQNPGGTSHQGTAAFGAVIPPATLLPFWVTAEDRGPDFDGGTPHTARLAH